MTSLANSIGLMAEVDMLFHARNPFFILQQFVWVTTHRIQQLRAHHGPLASIGLYFRFLIYILFIKEGFGIVFMMTFLMRDIDELYHGLEAVGTFARFVSSAERRAYHVFSCLLFMFHYRVMSHRKGPVLTRKHVFVLDLVYHVVRFAMTACRLAVPALKPSLLQRTLDALVLMYHTYVLWTLLRWIRLTLPIVKSGSPAREETGMFLSPAMSRLLLSLLEAQGGNLPMLRLIERYLRLQEQVRNLARILQEHHERVSDTSIEQERHQPDQLSQLALRILPPVAAPASTEEANADQ